MIIFSPRFENYQFSQPRSIFLIYSNTMYVFSIFCFFVTYVCLMSIQPLLVMYLNPLPHDKTLDQTKLKTFADDKLNVTKISVFDKSRKHCGKRRNCLYKQFLLFLQCFQKASFPDPSKGVIVWKWINIYNNIT